MLQGLHRYWPPLRDLVAELELELGHPCQANAYLTPPGLAGLRRPLRQPRRLRLPDPRHASCGRSTARTASEDVLLEPGLSMYLPTGTPHAARAQDGASLHVTARHQPAHLARRWSARSRRAASPRSPTTTCPPATSTTRASSPPRWPTGSRAVADAVRGLDAGRRRSTREVERFLTTAAARLARRAARRARRPRPRPTTPGCAVGAGKPVRAGRPEGDRLAGAARRPRPRRAGAAAPRPGAGPRATELTPADLATDLDAAEPAGAVPPAGPRGPARGRPVRPVTAPFRCAVEPRPRGDDLAGHRLDRPRLPAGRGTRALGRRRAARQPAARRRSSELRERRAARPGPAAAGPAARAGAAGRPRAGCSRRTPIRRGRGSRPTDARPARGRCSTSTWPRSARGESPGLDAGRRAGVRRVHPRPARRLLRRARPAGRRGAGDGRTPSETWEVSHIGGDRFAGNLLVLPARPLLRAARPGRRRSRSPATTSPAGSTSTTCAAGPACAMPVQAAEIALRRQLGETAPRRGPACVDRRRDGGDTHVGPRGRGPALGRHGPTDDRPRRWPADLPARTGTTGCPTTPSWGIEALA